MPKTRRPTNAQILYDIERVLADSVPPDWSLRTRFEVTKGELRVDFLAELKSPTHEVAVLVIEVKRLVEPRDVESAANQARDLAERFERGIPVVAASYLSGRSQANLNGRGVGYIDTTGNVYIRSASPGLYIYTRGADRDPWPQAHNLRSLRGRGSARAVRAVIDFAPPFGIRELAATSGASIASLSRVIGLLNREGLVDREPRGPVTAVDWQGAIRRWAEDYDQLRSNVAFTYLEPRGLGALKTKLARLTVGYAATGAFAAQLFDPIAPARMAGVYVNNPVRVAKKLDLRETEAGANVALLEPYDPVVFDRIVNRSGLMTVAPGQLAVDLLTGPGREPSQGEEMLSWMEANEDVWRT